MLLLFWFYFVSLLYNGVYFLRFITNMFICYDTIAYIYENNSPTQIILAFSLHWNLLLTFDHWNTLHFTKMNKMREKYYNGDYFWFCRTSKIGSFTNNVGMVLFDCDGTNKILTLHQEKPVKLELCDELLCDFDQFLDIYKVLTFTVHLFSRSTCFTKKTETYAKPLRKRRMLKAPPLISSDLH